MRLPANWGTIIEAGWRPEVLEAVRTSMRRGRLFGDAAWVPKTAERPGTGLTRRDAAGRGSGLATKIIVQKASDA